MALQGRCQMMAEPSRARPHQGVHQGWHQQHCVRDARCAALAVMSQQRPAVLVLPPPLAAHSWSPGPSSASCRCCEQPAQLVNPRRRRRASVVAHVARAEEQESSTHAQAAAAAEQKHQQLQQQQHGGNGSSSSSGMPSPWATLSRAAQGPPQPHTLSQHAPVAPSASDAASSSSSSSQRTATSAAAPPSPSSAATGSRDATTLQPPVPPPAHLELRGPDPELDQPPETGVLPDESMRKLAAAAAASTSGRSRAPSGGTLFPSSGNSSSSSASPSASGAATTTTTSRLILPGGGAVAPGHSGAGSSSSTARFAYPPAERSNIRESWGTLMRWSKVFRTKQEQANPLDRTRKVVVFGGGSFGTAMGCSLAHQKEDLDVVLLVRDPYLCKDINQLHCNTRYLKDFTLPRNMRATTSASEAIMGAQFAVHAVPVQSSRAFLVGVRDLLPPAVPIICVSKGLEVGTGLMMSEVVPSALERKHPAVFLSGPSFAREVMQNRPTGVVAACRDRALARVVQALFASPTMRVNITTDVVGVEICGALKNVLAIAAGIVEGLDLGNNAMAALIAQGCSEIRWLSEKMGAKATTMSGLSGLGDIMLTCYGNLSRNRSVGIRLGRGEKLEEILASSPQVAEGVATAGVVVGLARKYRVSLPVLTAVAQVLDNALTPSEAVSSIMNLPQIEER